MSYITSLRKFIGTKPIIAPGSAIIVLNERNELLLQLRSDTNDWGLPGGGMELGETFEETAKRELFEETGLITNRLELLELVSGKELYYKFPHGDEIYNATAVYKATEVTGTIKIDQESLDIMFFPLNSLPTLNHTTFKILEKIKLD
ncbi:NUDIX domain-containing protein [Bacillus mycoides]|uniref:NUDIX hydrolase n=1 Tax=Bacillus cereus group TaxID=86661 RepID=UPI0006D981C6|nr:MULTISPECIES: NUDIX hydrolase [Bacillus cereus group]KPU56762.1 NUDIX domain protein [Bacillus wiedmannii]MBG9713645.1 ADP-ribose pyrophosphatase [Bacillus cereus]QWG48859.1 NUDIX domain-containing protein [Bacillus mycoides]QWH32665.1 NUDIX domain-containing protein [Bacillus mycoides]